MGCLLKLHLPTILSFLIDVEAHMLSMPGKNNFGSRFNPSDGLLQSMKIRTNLLKQYSPHASFLNGLSQSA